MAEVVTALTSNGPAAPAPDGATEADWSRPPRSAPEPSGLTIDIEGYEGPLDLLLALARDQKVDLAKISILALADQYLAFVDRMRSDRLDLAADYLVMAAWLAYLKSRLLLPVIEAETEEPSAEALALMLAHRLRRLEAMREKAADLVARPRLGRDVFARGAPEPVAVDRLTRWNASLYDLLSAYALQRQRQIVNRVHVRKRAIWALADARDILERLLGHMVDWAPVESYLAAYATTPEIRASVRASAFSATLELVREGKLDVRQSGAFQPIYVRRAEPRDDAEAAVGPPVGDAGGSGSGEGPP